MSVVGHTAYYLPLGSPIESLRRGAVHELTRCLEAFAEIGAKWMNIHPDRYAPMHERPFYIERNLESLRELFEVSRRVGVGLMIENLPGDYNTVEQLGDLLNPLSDLGLHLDIGHANLQVPYNITADIMKELGQRMRNMNLQYNKDG